MEGKESPNNCYFFAGGGTGGHIYPAIAVAQSIRRSQPNAHIVFFCSRRPIDSKILSATDFDFVPLPGRGFSARPDKALSFVGSLFSSYDIAKKAMVSALKRDNDQRGVMIGIGGFASVPAVLAAGRVGLPIAMVNVDIVPGRANKLLGRFAKKIFVQFEETVDCFKNKDTVVVTGCPLRKTFADPDSNSIGEDIGLDPQKKTVVVTGASSGSLNINRAIAKILPQLDRFADTWQIVHLTGSASNTRTQQSEYRYSKIIYHLVDYCDDMASLYAYADLIVGRAGAVSVAEFAASATPAICLPYPYHKDRHQYLNAGKLVDAGAAVIVDDIPDDNDATAQSLAKELIDLMSDENRRNKMQDAARQFANISAAEQIASVLAAL